MCVCHCEVLIVCFQSWQNADQSLFVFMCCRGRMFETRYVTMCHMSCHMCDDDGDDDDDVVYEVVLYITCHSRLNLNYCL